MGRQFNPSRLKLARNRRKLTLVALANAVGMSSRMVAMYEKHHCEHEPTEQTIQAFCKVLGYPEPFFFGDDIDDLDPNTVSFRSVTKMSASLHHATIGAGQLGCILNSYFEANFNLPVPNLPDLRGIEPDIASEMIRDYWTLGDKSIKNLIHLLEIKGVRVFSLAEYTNDVDAFSFWKDGVPFIFLNTQKSGERSRFDAAHELGHLLLHRHGSPVGKDVEAEADSFASAFLMPETSILAMKSSFPTLDYMIDIKKNWLVSTMALIVRMKDVGAITGWQYRTLMVNASEKGLRTNEVNGIEREKSLVFDKLLSSLASEGITLPVLAKKLELPVDEISNLLFKFAVISGGTNANRRRVNEPRIKLAET